MIELETRSQRHREMIRVLGGVVANLRGDAAKGAAKTSPLEAVGSLMSGELAAYADLLMASGGLLPVRTDVLRQFVMYGNERPGEGESLPTYLARTQPVKLALTAMGLAAIASGEGGRARIMAEYLPQVMQGKLFCYCITEPDAGTNTNKISTIAIDEGEHFRLNGQKTFISAADTSHFMVTVAKMVRDGKEEGIGTFVMETATPGISMTPMDIAVLGDDQFTIHYDDVILPKAALVGSKAATKGKKISASVFYTLNLERIIVGLMTLSICKDALARAIREAQRSSTAADPEVRRKIARVKLKFEVANLATKRATEAYDNNEEPVRMGMYANMAKLISTEAANEACSLALELLGADGLDRDGEDVGALYQIARALRIIPINNEMVLNYLGENMLGMPKSYR
jgi:acyl-CoA dehydrogenase